MLLGKRQRPPMKRTTSLSEITFDLNAGDAQPSDSWGQPACPAPNSSYQPRGGRRNLADFVETLSFLRCCALCKRRLIPGRDIYMYRGDSAFCSQECRQQQINQDKRKDKKCSAASSPAAAKVSAVNGETVVAL